DGKLGAGYKVVDIRVCLCRHGENPKREIGLEDCANVPAGIAEVRELPVDELEFFGGIAILGNHQAVVPFHVAMDQALRGPLGAQGLERGAEFRIALNDAEDLRIASADGATVRRIELVDGKYPGHTLREGALEGGLAGAGGNAAMIG